MRFLDVKTDYAFKKVFGSAESKPILISFLNALIEFPPGAEIADLEIVDPYQIPLLKGMKDTYVDVKAVLADGRRVIVEMQVLNVQGFEQRILYNAAKAYSRQLLKGEDYSLLNPVIALTLTDFAMFEGAEVTSRFLLLEKERLIQYRGDIELIFVELPKFAKQEAELATLKDKWLYFVRHAGSLDLVPKPLDEAPLREAFDIANTAALTQDELEQQERRHDFILLQRGALKKAQEDGLAQGIAAGMAQGIEQGIEQGIAQGVAQGIAQGIAEGMAQGMAQGIAEGMAQGVAQGRIEEQRAIARRLLPLLDDAAVVAATDLPPEEVARLRAE